LKAERGGELERRAVAQHRVGRQSLGLLEMLHHRPSPSEPLGGRKLERDLRAEIPVAAFCERAQQVRGRVLGGATLARVRCRCAQRRDHVARVPRLARQQLRRDRV
jgi:hypothetical protein